MAAVALVVTVLTWVMRDGGCVAGGKGVWKAFGTTTAFRGASLCFKGG